ncbi:MAG TPA: VWA domain-containing protein [Pirellulales bacterium]|jgi:Mg-chelatase subunit ChlD|nr:VWA domain-containing protein [Pirellulales bacterium]
MRGSIGGAAKHYETGRRAGPVLRLTTRFWVALVVVGWLGAPAAAQSALQKLNELGQTKTTLFGVEAKGSSFVYVFDRSGSMDVPDGKPLRAAKDELLRSLDSLTDVQQFQIIFYNQRQSIFTPTGSAGHLLFGKDAMKEEAQKFVEGVKAGGATRHVDALVLAVKMRPDAIFLLTDGDEHDDMTEDEIARVIKLNTAGARIYVIQCSPPDQKNNHLIKLAQQTDGKHVYRDITKPANGLAK